MTGVTFLFVLYYYPNLPEMIPTHFDFNGVPDHYKQKEYIWFLPLLTIITYVSLLVVKRYPRILNYPVKITEENAEDQYNNAINLITVINLIIVISFSYLVYSKVQIAIGNGTGLGKYFLIIFLVALAIPTVISVYLAFKYK